MTNIKILENFEIEINKINDSIGKPSTDDSLFWLNQAVGKCIKQRFNGDAVHDTSYEQTEKRRIDLIRLFKQVKFNRHNITKISKQPTYDQYSI